MANDNNSKNNSNNYYEEDSDDEAPDLIDLDPDSNQNHVDLGVGVDTPVESSSSTVRTAMHKDNDSKDDGTTTTTSMTMPMPMIRPPCPVTILSGFLGSGKTTLIQYILKSPDHGRRIAVIENEFGEGLAIESIIARDGIDPGSGSALQDLIELPNGCVCCTVKDSLVEALETLIAKRSDLDYILIEASGMADPGPIASVFWLDDALESRIKLDGIVTLVDGRHIIDQLEATEEAARQIAYADRILLNKIDLLEHEQTRLSSREEEDERPEATTTSTKSATSTNATKSTSSACSNVRVLEVERAIRRIHPTAPILHTSFSKVPNLGWILDADCFSGFDHLEEVETSLKDASAAADALTTNNSHGHDHDHGNDHDCSECCEHDGTADNHNHAHHDHDHDHDHHEQEHEHTQHQHHHHHHHEDHKDTHTHTTSISTVAFEHSGSVEVKKLNAWLADILWPNQDETDKVLTSMLHQQEQELEQERDHRSSNEGNVNDATAPDPPPSKQNEHIAKSGQSDTQQQIFRIKGILSVRASDDYFWEEGNDEDDVASVGGDTEDGNGNSSNNNTAATDPAAPFLDPRRFIVQGVHDLWDIQPVTNTNLHWKSEEERTGKIVVIGKSLQEADLRAGFEACFLQQQ